MYPYIVRQTSNNGVKGYISQPEVYLNPENTITFAQDTFVSFYQKNKYFTGNKVKVLVPKQHVLLNSKNALFIVNSINKAVNKIGWGTGSTVESIENLLISLPTKNNKIDWKFMNTFVTELESQHVTSFKTYLKENGLNNCRLTKEERNSVKYFDKIKWGQISLYELFGNATRGKRLKSLDRKEGSLPFITAGETNEGISGYISNDVSVFQKNTITIDMFGSAKYRNYNYGADDHISVVHSENLSREENLFITAAIHRSAHNGQFSYGKNFYPKDADNLCIKLPINEQNMIDLDYMNSLISAVRKLLIKGVVDYDIK